MYSDHLEALRESISLLPDKEEVQRIIDIFKDHNRIILCTMGKSAFACRKVVYTARSYGLEWYDLDVCHAFHGDAGIIKEGDLLVLISKSGETEETIKVAKYFSDWKTISITSNPDSSLSQVCDNNLNIPVVSEGSPFGYAPMVSTSVYMVVLHAILCEFISNREVRLDEYARNHPAGKIGRMLKDDAKNKK